MGDDIAGAAGVATSTGRAGSPGVTRIAVEGGISFAGCPGSLNTTAGSAGAIGAGCGFSTITAGAAGCFVGSTLGLVSALAGFFAGAFSGLTGGAGVSGTGWLAMSFIFSSSACRARVA